MNRIAQKSFVLCVCAAFGVFADTDYDKREIVRNISSVSWYDIERNDPHQWQTELADKPDITATDIAEILRKADGGDLSALCQKGILHYWGIGVEKSQMQASECFLKAAKGGDGRAIKCLSECYYLGIGMAKDDLKGYMLWRKAANSGYVPAMLSMGDHCLIRHIDCGWCLRKGGCDGKAVTCPLYWYKMAADNGSVVAKLKMTDVYAFVAADLRSVDVRIKDYGHMDMKLAGTILKELRSSKDSRIAGMALEKVGRMVYVMGDKRKALSYFEQSALLGNLCAIRNMARLERGLYNKDMIIERKINMAKKWNENRSKIHYEKEDIRPILVDCENRSSKKRWRSIYEGMPIIEAIVLARYYNPEAIISLTPKLMVNVKIEGSDSEDVWLCKGENDGVDVVVKEVNDTGALTKVFYKQRDDIYLGFISEEPSLVWPKVKLDEISSVSAYFCGRGVERPGTVVAQHLKRKGDVVTAQFQRVNFGLTVECVGVEFSQQEKGVFARAVYSRRRKSKDAFGCDFDDEKDVEVGKIATGIIDNGCGIKNVRLNAEE